MKITLLLSIVLCAAMAVSASTPCGSNTCAGDELCNSDACQCNLGLYSYSASNPTPNVTCDNGKFNIQVSKCWLERNGYNSSNVRLESTSCLAAKEIVNETAQMAIHRPLTTTDCNTTSAINGTHVIFNNKLYIFAKTSGLVTRKDVVMDVSCSYPLNANVSLNVTLKPILGSTVISGPNSTGSYVVNMIAYKDPEFATPLSESDTLYVEDTVYISVGIPNLDDTFKLKVGRIYASPDNTSSIQYNLLDNGCPSADVPKDLLTVQSNGAGSEARFIMKVFQIANSNTVSLSADIQLCQDNCVPDCSSKSVDTRASAGRVSIVLDASERFDTSSSSGISASWSLSSLIFSWILMKLM